MITTSKLPPLLLLILLLVFPYFTFSLAHANGLVSLIEHICAEARFPDGTPLRTVYVGIPAVDSLLSMLVVFFTPAVTPSFSTLTTSTSTSTGTGSYDLAVVLHMITFSGFFIAVWIPITLELWRAGNMSTAAAYSVHLGLAIQRFSFAFGAPAYSLIHLLTSTTASRPTRTNMRVPSSILRALPAIFFVGSVLPTLAIFLPPLTSSTASASALDRRQLLTAAWQSWPLYTAVGLTAVSYLFPSSSPSSNHPPSSSSASASASASALRLIYAMAFATAAITHLAATTISLATVLVPSLFRPGVAPALHPARVLAVALPWQAQHHVPISSLADGVHFFLRWDYILSSTALLLWTAVLYARAYRHYEGRRVRLLKLLTAKILPLVLVAGPGAAAVELMWEREEFVLQSADSDDRKRASSAVIKK